MANAVAGPSLLSDRLKTISDGDALMGIGIVVILSVMLLPLPSSFLDILLVINLSSGLVVLLTAIYSYPISIRWRDSSGWFLSGLLSNWLNPRPS